MLFQSRNGRLSPVAVPREEEWRILLLALERAEELFKRARWTRIPASVPYAFYDVWRQLRGTNSHIQYSVTLTETDRYELTRRLAPLVERYYRETGT